VTGDRPLASWLVIDVTPLSLAFQRLLPVQLRDGERGRRATILVVALAAACVGTIAVGIWQRAAGSPLIGLVYLAGSGTALALFALVSSITPGPNNLMLMASGANFGLRRTLPHMIGVLTGFAVLAFAAGIGIGALYATMPGLRTALRWIGSAALVYLAWRIASAGRAEHPEDAKPLRLLEAAAFQFANPKGWLFAITAAAAFLSEGGARGAAVPEAGRLAVH